MYYILKFSDSWSAYDGIKGSSRPLQADEINLIKGLFPALLDDKTKILVAVQVSAIQPNKLLNLPYGENGVRANKAEAKPKT